MILKPIEKTIFIELTPEEVVEYNTMVDKYYTRKDGLPSENEDMNKCPNCKVEFGRGAHYCSVCGQWVHFRDYDYIPL